MAVLPRATEYTGTESTRVAARNKPTDDVMSNFLAKLNYATSDIDPLTSFKRLKAEKSGAKEQSIAKRIDLTLNVATDLVMEQNQLLRYIIDEMKKIEIASNDDTDVDLARRNRTRTRVGGRVGRQFERSPTTRQTISPRTIPSRGSTTRPGYISRAGMAASANRRQATPISLPSAAPRASTSLIPRGATESAVQQTQLAAGSITSSSTGRIMAAVPRPSAVAGSTGALQQPEATGDFATELNRVSSKFNVNPADMLALMRSESGLDPQAVNASSGATGLIQFMPSTARSLGTTTEALRAMTAAQQMQYVERYFDSVRLPPGSSAGRLYAYVFLPGRANREVLTSRGEAFYEANRGLDMDGDGNITITDLDVRMARYGGSLTTASSGMAAADQAQLIGTGRQVIIPPTPSENNAVAPTGSAARSNVISEVPLNRRLEKQVV